MHYQSENVKIPLIRELHALGTTTEMPNEQDVLQRQTESETLSQPNTPSESPQSSKMPESIKITKPDKFDGNDTSIATVTTWTFSVKEYMELTEVPEDKQSHLAA